MNDDDLIGATKCVNCGRPDHVADIPYCPSYLDAKNAIKLSVQNNKGIRNARNKYNSLYSSRWTPGLAKIVAGHQQTATFSNTKKKIWQKKGEKKMRFFPISAVHLTPLSTAAPSRPNWTVKHRRKKEMSCVLVKKWNSNKFQVCSVCEIDRNLFDVG